MVLRKTYEKQLEELNQELIDMGALCEDAIGFVAMALPGETETAGAAVHDVDPSAGQEPTQLIERVYFADSQIDRSEREIEALCLKLLLRQQPVATDLRLVSAALKMISDMERIGDQCADIADIVRVLDAKKAIKLESAVDIQAMATATMKMVTKAVDSFVSRNLVVARGVIEADDTVDDLFNKVKSELIALVAKEPEQGEVLLDLLMVAKYFERIGDHATNIAEWVEFSITGEHEAKAKYQKVGEDLAEKK